MTRRANPKKTLNPRAAKKQQMQREKEQFFAQLHLLGGTAVGLRLAIKVLVSAVAEDVKANGKDDGAARMADAIERALRNEAVETFGRIPQEFRDWAQRLIDVTNPLTGNAPSAPSQTPTP